ncbi:F0F1 ATP synthase subunit epsilon [Parapusillimonas granuli]|uniref:ATP synthase epsilon chain n=1 Tax=Parapusillimonas granuli TaxID=380911 RepID=A0A853G3H2_9BURK|nr:F0F1 ATP synthase subunit epsilon [Parapusillimonas granuli]MBB5214959.1 F-type H+-transporting ATPase subunit epsilon [Parapusillimonas granuli]MEB2401182.1 hypothetical protein [Alcaligenaceae bacterium]NYT49281.1 F0F1 ATP synthase subunit epsilon [Parapusillimonas granuli]
MSADHVMRLRVLTPAQAVVDVSARKLVAEGTHGFFAVLPRHIDAVVALPASLLSYVTADGSEHFIGTDEGILVKQGAEVCISVLDAFESDDLDALRERLAQHLSNLEDHERTARSAIARLEAGAIRHVMEIR